MNPACQLCAGACCETICLPHTQLPVHDADWLKRHGCLQGDHVELPCRCRCLLPDGRCAEYDERPLTCRVYEMGGHACLATVARRRPHLFDEIVRLITEGKA